LSTPAALGLGVAVLWVARGRGSRAAPQPQVAAEHDASPTPPEPAPAAPAAPPTPVQPQLTLEEWLERAREHLKRDEVEQALAAYDEVVALDPQRYDSYSARGTTRFRAGDRAGALADYQRLIELDPEHPSSKMARGLVARLERELREAPEPKPQPTPDPPPPADREEALRHYNALAAKHERAREWEAAEAAYAHLLELEPSRGTTYSQRATMRFKSGNKRGALADYRRFLELYDGDPGLRKPVEDMIRGLEAELGR
ncbi:MAG: tetratricopeptide repeat protein, partial [Planctomycetes bacterium]|nr:tetratricopeptide repeat protein [Planctomycetota bacterium]